MSKPYDWRTHAKRLAELRAKCEPYEFPRDLDVFRQYAANHAVAIQEAMQAEIDAWKASAEINRQECDAWASAAHECDVYKWDGEKYSSSLEWARRVMFAAREMRDKIDRLTLEAKSMRDCVAVAHTWMNEVTDQYGGDDTNEELMRLRIESVVKTVGEQRKEIASLKDRIAELEKLPTLTMLPPEVRPVYPITEE